MTDGDDTLTPPALPPTPAPQYHEQKFEGRRDQVREGRRFLAGILNDCPAADEVLLVASELATNAVVHSASGEPGGTFTITAEVRDCEQVRIEVRDDGGPWHQRDHGDGRPHGLDIIATLATEHGVSGDPLTSWTAWAVLPWHPAPPSPRRHQRTDPHDHQDD